MVNAAFRPDDPGGPRVADGDSRPKAVLESPDIRRALTRITHEILERTKGGHDVVLLGIQTRGVTLAERLADLLREVEGRPVPWGSLDVTMYRDDLRMKPARALGRTELPPGASTTASWSSSTTCCSPAAPCGPRWTR